jgi:hypothetical protein
MTWNRLTQIILTVCLGATLGWMSLSAGCNPQLIGSLGGERHLPITPGATDYILIRFYNAASMPAGTGMEFNQQYRIAGGAMYGFGGVTGLVDGEDFGQLIPCNVTVVTLGDVDDPTVAGAYVIYNPPLDPVRRAIKPLGKILQNGIDFRCGDTITFISVNDSTASEGYSLTYNVLSGQDQSATFSGPDAFALFEQERDDFITLISRGGYPW